MEQKDNKKKRNIVFYISLISQIGISMMVPIFLCGYIGLLLSKKLDMDFLVLISIFFGFAVSFRNVYVLTRGIYASDYEKEKEQQRYFDDMKKEREARISKNNGKI